MDKNKTIILGLSIAALVLLVGMFAILVSIIVNSSHRSACELSDKVVVIDQSKLENIPSGDFKTLVKIYGHIKYERSDEGNIEDKIYLPLTVTIVEPSETNSSFKIVTDCAKLTFYLEKVDQSLSVSHIDVDLSIPNGNVTSCYYQNDLISAPIGKHYACSTEISDYCFKFNETDSDKPVATLFFSTLEFEVNGNQKLIKDRKFSTEPHLCSLD